MLLFIASLAVLAAAASAAAAPGRRLLAEPVQSTAPTVSDTPGDFTVIVSTRTTPRARLYAISGAPVEGVNSAESCSAQCSGTTKSERGPCVSWSWAPAANAAAPSAAAAAVADATVTPTECLLFAHFPHLEEQIAKEQGSSYGYNAAAAAETVPATRVQGYTYKDGIVSSNVAGQLRLPTTKRMSSAFPQAECAQWCNQQPATTPCEAFVFRRADMTCELFAAPLALHKYRKKGDGVYAYKSAPAESASAKSEVDVSSLEGYEVLANMGSKYTVRATNDEITTWDLGSIKLAAGPKKCAEKCDEVPGGACVAWQTEVLDGDWGSATMKCYLYAKNLTATSTKPIFKPGATYGYVASQKGRGEAVNIKGYTVAYNTGLNEWSEDPYQSVTIDSYNIIQCAWACDKDPDCYSWTVFYTGGATCSLYSADLKLTDTQYEPGTIFGTKGDMSAVTAKTQAGPQTALKGSSGGSSNPSAPPAQSGAPALRGGMHAIISALLVLAACALIA